MKMSKKFWRHCGSYPILDEKFRTSPNSVVVIFKVKKSRSKIKLLNKMTSLSWEKNAAIEILAVFVVEYITLVQYIP